MKVVLVIFLVIENLTFYSGDQHVDEPINGKNSNAFIKMCSLSSSINKMLKITASIKNEFVSAHYPENIPLKSEYDFVIVGSGPAGCVLANRLSENENYTVLVIEAGAAENPLITNIPMNAPNLQSTSYNWNYATEVQENACLSMRDKRCNWPHGRGLGGSSIINYMIYTRGNRRDFDRWAAAGNSGWSYQDVLPYFQKIEKSMLQSINETGDSFGKNGSLVVEDPPFRTRVSKAFVESAILTNYSQINYNGGDQIGVNYLQATTKNGWRQTAAKAFLADVKHRPNLDISLKSWATKLITSSNGNHLKGVKFYRNKREIKVNARKEVILAAGAFQSPKLLMLSGIGPKEHLDDLKIKVIKDLPVGQTLYEHMAVFGPIFTADNLTDGLINMEDILKLKPILEFLDGKGPIAITGIESLLYMKTNNSISSDPAYPDIELLQSMATVGFDSAHGTKFGIRLSDETYDSVFKPLENRRAFQILPMLLHPRSKGYIKLKSRNPFHHPLFYPNFFADARDIDTLLDGIRETLKIVQQAPFKELGVKLYNATVPGCEHTTFNTDEYWRCYIRHLSATLHHQVATCKMGPKSDQTSVVDATARVHGFSNLRVADVSIIPESPSGHTAAFSFMIGEKIADAIRSDWDSKEIEPKRVLRDRRLVVDWLYEEHTIVQDVKPSSTTEPSYISKHLVSTAKSYSPQHLAAMHALNITALSENSQQFRNQTIGDVADILWGTQSPSKTKDFKSQLIEHDSSTSLNYNQSNTVKLKSEKDASTTARTTVKESPTERTEVTLPKVENKQQESFIVTTSTVSSQYANVSDKIENENAAAEPESDSGHVMDLDKVESIETTTIKSNASDVPTLSGMDKIMATAPSLDEDMIKTYTLNGTDKYGRGRAKAKHIRKELKKMNITTYMENQENGHSNN